MDNYKEIVDDLFKSKGDFRTEFREILYNLPYDKQEKYIIELYGRVSSNQHDFQREINNFGGPNNSSKPNYYYAEEDLEKAINSDLVTSGENIL